MDYILKVLNEESSEWEPIEAIKGVDGEPGPIGPAGPQGEPGTTHWGDLEDKPFETLGEGLSVDSEGVLSAEGGLKIFEYKSQYTPEEVAEMGPGTAIYTSDSSLRGSYFFDSIGSDNIYYYNLLPTEVDNGSRGQFKYKIIRVNIDTGIVQPMNGVIKTVPSFNLSKAGNILTVNSTGYEMEWAEPADPLPSYTSSDVGKVLTVVETSEGEEVQWDELQSSGIESIVIPSSSLPYTLTAEEQAKVKIGTLLIIYYENQSSLPAYSPEM